MKIIMRGYGIGMNSEERQTARRQATDTVLTRGTGQRPLPPRDIQIQSGPRGMLVTWKYSAGYIADIRGWRVYRNTESELFQEIHDRGTRQCFIPATAGSSPPVQNVFVSSLNGLGLESQRVQAQGSATTESGAPTMPSSPPGYTIENPGGADLGGGVSSTGGALVL